ncbi:MAG: hypothetical protein LBP87_02625 [Planctomycetaceae bacterium]|jgi:hypothetical protein|nr:hypothetical protein [Planctomycetaceae bacterium]
MISFRKKKKGDETTETTPARETVSSTSSTPSETPITIRKPKPAPDIYTLLLGLSVVALIIATVLLYLNLTDYGPNPLAGIKT